MQMECGTQLMLVLPEMVLALVLISMALVIIYIEFTQMERVAVIGKLTMEQLVALGFNAGLLI